MIKLYRIIKFFFIYRKNVLKNRKFLEEKYGFEINLLTEFYTTVTLNDAPQELKDKFGKALLEIEVKKFLGEVNKDLPKLELNELANVYELKRIDDDNCGVAYGYALANNTILLLSLLSATLTLITVLLIIIF